jgi:hypothetical protein
MNRREVSRLGGLANRGTKKTPEHPARISESVKRSWQQRRAKQQPPGRSRRIQERATGCESP